MATGRQPRWPKGTPVAPSGRGPGGGRFRDDGKPNTPRPSWDEVAPRVAGRAKSAAKKVAPETNPPTKKTPAKKAAPAVKKAAPAVKKAAAKRAPVKKAAPPAKAPIAKKAPAKKAAAKKATPGRTRRRGLEREFYEAVGAGDIDAAISVGERDLGRSYSPQERETATRNIEFLIAERGRDRERALSREREQRYNDAIARGDFNGAMSVLEEEHGRPFTPEQRETATRNIREMIRQKNPDWADRVSERMGRRTPQLSTAAELEDLIMGLGRGASRDEIDRRFDQYAGHLDADTLRGLRGQGSSASYRRVVQSAIDRAVERREGRSGRVPSLISLAKEGQYAGETPTAIRNAIRRQLAGMDTDQLRQLRDELKAFPNDGARALVSLVLSGMLRGR